LAKLTQELNWFTNPSLLKVELLTKGMRLERTALENSAVLKWIELSEKSGASLELPVVLPDKVLVNIPITACFDETACYSLAQQKQELYLTRRNKKIKVEVLPPPDFYKKSTSSGIPFVEIGKIYGSYLLLSPIVNCEFLTQGLACQYCDVEGRPKKDRSIDEILETVKIATQERGIENVCLNVGFANSEDGGIKRLAPYIKAIRKHFDTLVCVQAQPPKTNQWINKTYALGVDSIAYNLEVFDSELFSKVAPGKMKLVSRSRYLEALAWAAKVFPSGAVVSNLIVGLEPSSSTIKGINYLVSIGVIPTLPIYRSTTTGSDADNPEINEIVKIFSHLDKTLKKHRISPSLISHFNLVINAIDGKSFGGEAPMKYPWQAVINSRTANKLALSLRRRLRVKKTSQSK
jgi:hypothetical protein